MPPEMPPYRLRPDVRYQPVDGEGVVVRQEAAEVLILNEVATRILALVDEGLGPLAILERLAGQFDANRERLAADLDAFLAELRAAGLIEKTNRP